MTEQEYIEYLRGLSIEDIIKECVYKQKKIFRLQREKELRASDTKKIQVILRGATTMLDVLEEELRDPGDEKRAYVKKKDREAKENVPTLAELGAIESQAREVKTSKPKETTTPAKETKTPVKETTTPDPETDAPAKETEAPASEKPTPTKETATQKIDRKAQIKEAVAKAEKVIHERGTPKNRRSILEIKGTEAIIKNDLTKEAELYIRGVLDCKRLVSKPRKNKVVYEPPAMEVISAMYKEKIAVADIANKFGVSHVSIKRVLLDSGVYRIK